MEGIAKYALMGWPAVVAVIFMAFSFRRAILISILSGWMFLPIYQIHLKGLPEIDKRTMVMLPVAAACLLWELRGWSRRPKFRMVALDYVMLYYCLINLASSTSNSTGLWEGFSGVYENTLTLGVPYLIGRLYFCDKKSVNTLAHALFLAGAAYLPFCILEVRLAPFFHYKLYGAHQHKFVQSLRFGSSYRPTVFMRHGLEVSLWMAFAALIGIWLFRSGRLSKGYEIILVLGLIMTSFLCKSFTAIFLLICGFLVLYLTTFFKRTLPVALLLVIPSLYLLNRVADMRVETHIVEFVRPIFPQYRHRSLTYRLNQEYALVGRANKKMIFGWGRFGNYHLRDAGGRAISVADSRWIIEYAKYGLNGLIPFLLIFFLPIVRTWKRVDPRRWDEFEFAAPAVLAVSLMLLVVDMTLNNFIGPVHLLMAGGLGGQAIRRKMERETKRPREIGPYSARVPTAVDTLETEPTAAR